MCVVCVCVCVCVCVSLCVCVCGVCVCGVCTFFVISHRFHSNFSFNLISEFLDYKLVLSLVLQILSFLEYANSYGALLMEMEKNIGEGSYTVTVLENDIRVPPQRGSKDRTF